MRETFRNSCALFDERVRLNTLKQAFFFGILRKTQVEEKLRFLRKLRYFSQNSGSKSAKTYLNRKKLLPGYHFYVLGLRKFARTQVYS